MKLLMPIIALLAVLVATSEPVARFLWVVFVA
jgi:hypothetical protein